MKKRIILIISLVLIGIIATIVTVSANNNIRSQRNINDEAKKNPKVVESDPKLVEELKKDKKMLDEKFEAQEKILNANDKKAGEIVKKYLNKDVTVLTYDKYEDYKTMKVMVDLINNDPGLSQEELKIVKNYLDRRYSWIDDNEELKSSIMKILGRTY